MKRATIVFNDDTMMFEAVFTDAKKLKAYKTRAKQQLKEDFSILKFMSVKLNPKIS